MMPNLIKLLCGLLLACLALGTQPSLVLAGGPASRPGTDPAGLAQAQALVKLNGMDQRMRRASEQAVLPLVRQVLGADPRFGPKDLETMSRAWAQTVWHDLGGEMQMAAAKLYAEHFTPAELQRLREFYASPLGHKLVRLEPLLRDQADQRGVKVVTAWLARLNADPGMRRDFFRRVAEKLPPELRGKTGQP